MERQLLSLAFTSCDFDFLKEKETGKGRKKLNREVENE